MDNYDDDAPKFHEFHENAEYEKKLPENWESLNINDEIKKLKKIPRPDYAKQKQLTEQMRSQVDHISDRIKEVDDKIASLISGTNNNHRNIRQEIIKQLKDKKMEISQVSRERKELLKQRDEIDKIFQSSKSKEKNLKNEMKYRTVEEIEGAIYDMEYKYNTESLNMNQQKDLLKEIQRLKKSKLSVEEFTKVADSKLTSSQSIKDINTSIKTLGDKIGEISGEIDKLEKQLDVQNNIQSVDKTEGLREEKQKLYDQKKSSIADRKKKIEEFTQLISDYDEYQYQMQQLNYIKRKQEHERKIIQEKQKEKEEEEKKKTQNPYLKEINTITRLIPFLESFLPKTTVDTTKAKVIPNEIKLSSGVVQTKLVKEVDHFGGFKPNKKNKNKQNQPQSITPIPNAPSTTTNENTPKIDEINKDNIESDNVNNQSNNNKNKKKKNKNKLINLGLSTLSDFNILNMKPPIDVDDVPQCIEELKQKKVHFETFQPGEGKAATPESSEIKSDEVNNGNK